MIVSKEKKEKVIYQDIINVELTIEESKILTEILINYGDTLKNSRTIPSLKRKQEFIQKFISDIKNPIDVPF